MSDHISPVVTFYREQLSGGDSPCGRLFMSPRALFPIMVNVMNAVLACDDGIDWSELQSGQNTSTEQN